MSDMTPPIDRSPTRLAGVARVLQEAEAPSVPLPERLRLLGRAGSALEDLLRVQGAARVALAKHGKGRKARARLEAAASDTRALLDTAVGVLHGRLLPALAGEGVRLLDPARLDPFCRSWIRTCFEQRVVARIAARVVASDSDPIGLPEGRYLVVGRRVDPDDPRPLSAVPFGLVWMPMPPGDRFVVLPDVGEGRPVIRIDDLVRAHVDRLFPEFMPGDAFALRRVTLTADGIAGRVDGKAARRLLGLIEAQGRGWPVLEVDRQIPFPLLASLLAATGLSADHVTAVGRHPGTGDWADFPDLPGDGEARGDGVPEGERTPRPHGLY